jgi:hypothetical protein
MITNALTVKNSLTSEETYLFMLEFTLVRSPTHALTVQNGLLLSEIATITREDTQTRNLIAATYVGLDTTENISLLSMPNQSIIKSSLPK